MLFGWHFTAAVHTNGNCLVSSQRLHVNAGSPSSHIRSHAFLVGWFVVVAAVADGFVCVCCFLMYVCVCVCV